MSNSQLFMACKNGDYQTSKSLELNPSTINITDEDGNTPLMFAVESRNIELINLLIDKGADVSKANKVGYCPLVVAVMSENTKAVEELLNAGAVIDMNNNWIVKCINYADNNDFHKINRLLKEHNESKKTDEEMNLSENEKNKIYLKLLELIESEEINEFTKLFKTHESWINVNKEIENTFSVTTLLAECCEIEKYDLAKLLLEKGANPNQKTGDVWTPFSYVFSPNGGCDEKLVRLYVENGADVDAQDGGGFTALMYFSSYGNEEMVRYMLSKKANKYLTSNNGYDALSLAERDNHVGVIKLLKNPPKANIQNNSDVSKDTKPLPKGIKVAMWVFSILGGLIGLIIAEQIIKSPVWDDKSKKSAKVARNICIVVIIISAFIFFLSNC